MALNGNDLGIAIKEAVEAYNNKTPEDIGDIEIARLNYWKAVGNTIVDYFKTNAALQVPGAGLTAASTPVTGTSITGTIN